MKATGEEGGTSERSTYPGLLIRFPRLILFGGEGGALRILDKPTGLGQYHQWLHTGVFSVMHMSEAYVLS